jgi:signal peptidase I
VPEGRYFVMGDNRDNSNDSRRWGTVRPQEIKGPVTYLYWSWTNPSGWLTILKPWTWWHLLTQQTRWNRFGNPVI